MGSDLEAGSSIIRGAGETGTLLLLCSNRKKLLLLSEHASYCGISFLVTVLSLDTANYFSLFIRTLQYR